MTPLNILIFEVYPFGKEGGNIRTLSYILKFMDKTKFNPVLLTPFETDFTNRVREQGIECIVIKPPKRLLRYGGACLRGNLASRFLTMLDMVPYNLKLMSVIRKKKIDVIYCNCIRAVLSTALSAKLSRKPMLWYIKGELQNKLLDKIGFIFADKILFQSEFNKNDKYPVLTKIWSKKIDILKSGVDPESIEKAKRRDRTKLIEDLSLNKDQINIIFLGQLYRPKGVHYLLEAMSLIVKEFPDINLYIVGDHVIDEYKGYVEELFHIIERYRLNRNVVFTGWRIDALEILSVMDILVHPSLSEGFPRAVLEAMALGKPVVASRKGGTREIIKDGENGFLVEARDPEALAEKLVILLRDKDLRMRFGRRAQETVFSKYLIQEKIRELEDIWCDMAMKSLS